MSNWMTRFEGAAVGYAEIAAAPHRARVAWGWYLQSQVLSRVSDYFVRRSGHAESLEIARGFWESGDVDPTRVGRAMVHTAAAFDELTGEGYSTAIIVSGLSLLGSVIDPDPDLRPRDTRDIPMCRFPVDPGVVTRPEAYDLTTSKTEVLQSKAALAYVEVVLWDFWRQGYGIGVEDIKDLDYLDDVMSQFIRFARDAFTPLSRATQTQLPSVVSVLPQLMWSAPPPPSDRPATASTSSIPYHERASV